MAKGELNSKSIYTRFRSPFIVFAIGCSVMLALTARRTLAGPNPANVANGSAVHEADAIRELADPLAAWRRQRGIIPDGQDIRTTPERDKLIWDFTNIAFSNALWLGDSVDPSASLMPFKSYLQLRSKKTPNENWVNEFGHRSKGLPAHDRIVKWMQPITIGIGWPQFGTSESGKIDPALLEVARAQINKLIPELKSSIGQAIEFIPPNDPREKTRDYARIRIVFVPGTNLRNHFKVLNYSPDISMEDWYYQLNSSYVAAIPLTPTTKAQVDGFLLPNADNSLRLAVCRIVGVLPADMLRALISECLVRSMGLPELSRENTEALVGTWNRAYEETEKHPFRDGNAALLAPFSKEQGKTPAEYYKTLPAVANSIPNDLTGYDRSVLSALYCSTIKPGDDKYQVITSLLQDEKCINEQ